MNIAFRLFAFCAVMLLPIHRTTAATSSGPTADLQKLVSDVQARLRTGPVTEKDLAGEISRFDDLLERYRGQRTAEVAQILFMKGTLYIEVLNQPDRGREILEQVVRDYPDTPQVARSQSLLNYLEARSALTVGAVFPDFEETDTVGRPLSVSQYKGKVVLVDFWAMWCGPCLQELPNVIAAYDKYHDRGFEIIGISLDREGDGPKLADFTASRGMPWPQYFDGGYWQTKLAVKYGVRSIPNSYLIDREGRIAAVNPRGPVLEQEIARVLNQL